MSSNAPPGGGPGATVIATSNGNQPAPPAPAPVDDKLLPNGQPAAPAQPAAPTAPPAADALSLEPAAPAQPAAPANAAPTVTVPDYGDNGLNIAAEYFVNTVGLDIDSRELTEAAKGNFALLEAKLEVLGDKAKGSAPILALAKESIARVTAAATAAHTANVAAVHEAVGGAENWAAIQQFARANLPADQLKQASESLSAGGFGAQATARYLMAMAQANPATTVKGAPATNAAAPTASINGVAPLTKEQYRAEYRKLVAEKGIRGAAHSEELRALNARVIH
ncbi:capsid and scaffold protein [Xanthomonas phage f30-Xaj]|uniref:Capsid and scaffold protein n=1 Tax=Xanthomonas phage f30-Xaj TaxID=1784981 RepID=A0A127AVK6_9CAUD|nr:head scaffolding protein [Xanthomonas phage f30-Xaj]AMM44685.1 capsid and scaffold protein [Xanthomonas phage f30-Xaj]